MRFTYPSLIFIATYRIADWVLPGFKQVRPYGAITAGAWAFLLTVAPYVLFKVVGYIIMVLIIALVVLGGGLQQFSYGGRSPYDDHGLPPFFF